jgi:hypothetical protein
MYVVGYYSLIFNTYEEDRHPAWKMHDGSGFSRRDKGDRYGLCCPNNQEYRAFVKEQIKEMSEYFTVDGMFYDMPFWPLVCRCDSCKSRFAVEVGGGIPEENWKDPRWLAFTHKRREWMSEFVEMVRKETKRLMPEVTVEFNFATALSKGWHYGIDEAINEACDFTGGDLYGDLYNHSFTCKYYMNITKNPPFEYMTCRCSTTLSQHTVTKTEEALTLEIMLTGAHHGASLIIDALDPRGTMDKRVYERVGQVFSKQIPLEKYFYGELVADVGIYYSTASKYNGDGQDFTSTEGAINTVKTMIENHVPVSVVSAGCPEKIDSHKFIFVPYLYELEDIIADRLIHYVENGGNLYFSGAGCEKLLQTLVGGVYTGEMTRETRTYLAPVEKSPFAGIFGEFNRDFPMPFMWRLPLVRMSEEGVVATVTLPYTARDEKRFASIHSDPPGIATQYPGLVIKKYGKGNVIWSAVPLELDNRIQYKRFVMNLLHLFIKPEELTVRADTSANIELVSFRANDGYFVSAVDLKCTEEMVKIRPIKISVKTRKPAREVISLPDKKPVAFENRNGETSFTMDEFAMCAFYQIIF